MNFCSIGRVYKPILSFPFHTHENWELILQSTAHTVATAGDCRFELQAGDLIVIPPGLPHNTVSDTGFLDIHLQLRKCDFPTFPFQITDTDGTIARLFDMTLEAFTEKAEGYEIFTEKLSDLICLYIQKKARDQSLPSFINDFKMLLMQNIENPQFDLSKSIAKTGYNPDHFRRIFHKHMGCSPLTYLTRLRMDHARELLRFEPHLTISQVAYRCGFMDNLYFSSRFKKTVGCSPSQYQKTLGDKVSAIPTLTE